MRLAVEGAEVQNQQKQQENDKSAPKQQVELVDHCRKETVRTESDTALSYTGRLGEKQRRDKKRCFPTEVRG
jgi:hypothetical protein